MTSLTKPKSKRRESWAEARLAFRIAEAGLPEPVREYAFAAPARKWLSDFAFLRQRVLVEVEGGTFARGRHTRGDGFEKDCEKYNAATLEGWVVLRVTPRMISSGDAITVIRRALNGVGRLQ